MKSLSVLTGALILLGLTGCEAVESIGQSIQNIQMPTISSPSTPATQANGLVAAAGAECPQVKALPDLASITQFSDPANPQADKMIASTSIDNVGASCQVSPNSVSVELSLDFSGTLGPVGVKDLNGQANYTYPYFLTVITPDGQILSKDVFALSTVYENKQISVKKQDKLRQVIPLMAGQSANQFQILIGFQLSDAELAYNRSRKQ